MVGGGGKIGGPGGAPPVVPPAQNESVKPADAKSTTAPPTDQFEKGGSRPLVDGGPGGKSPASMAREGSGATDLLRLARENPAAARQLAATLAGQSATTLSEIEREMAAARLLLEKLSQERFSKEARKKSGDKLTKQRERLAALKMRMAMGMRKMALLQQVAGKLGDPRLDEELDRLLSHHKKLKTAWGKSHHLLSTGSALYGCVDDTPEHLQEVVKTEIRAGGRGDEVGDALGQISPRRVIAELIARTLDGSTTEPSELDAAAKRGEFGESMQSYALLSEILEEALVRDPFEEA